MKSIIVKHKILITIYLLFLISSIKIASGQEIKNKTIIPMDLSINKPVIELNINGKGPYKFILDTGAGANIIDTETASELELEIIDQMKVGSPSSSNWFLADVVNVSKINVEDIELSDISMATENLKKWFQVDGIISIQSFSEYLITLDFPGKIIVLEKGDLTKRSIDVTPFNSDFPIISFQIEVAGQKKEAHIDTGSPQSFAFPYSFKEKLNLKSDLYKVGYAHIGPDSFMVWRSQLNEDIKMGNIKYKSPEIVFEDRIGDHVNIGYLVTKNLSITIDLKNSLLKFERKPTTNNSTSDRIHEKNEFTGRYGGVRSITFDNGNLYLQRDGGIKLKLIAVKANMYAMELPNRMKPANKLPKIRFERNNRNVVEGFFFVHDDGKEEYIPRD